MMTSGIYRRPFEGRHLVLILNYLYLGDLILILKSSTYDDFAHLWAHDILKHNNNNLAT